jgi:glycosyltransferase involved in cell wall biosynthesis
VRIGIVAYWFNRGQGVVARHLRSALEELGHETFVLARPTRETNIRPSRVDEFEVWNQPLVTAASGYDIPWTDYAAWAEANSPELVFFDQNYGFEEIARLRSSGVRTIGRFVWEQFSPRHVKAATEAFDCIYSMTACERERYATLGIESPRVRWGVHPELLAHASDLAGAERDADGRAADASVRFFFPGGFMSKRKPIKEVLKAFRRTDDERLRLLMKAQVSRRVKAVQRATKRDPRIDVIWDELLTDEYLRLFASMDVCLAPSRWEGLGLHLYEATAFGLPIITNDVPPMNEVVRDGDNGLLVRSATDGEARSGIPAYLPKVRELSKAIERLADPELRSDLAAGARRRRDELRWENTVADLEALVEPSAGASRPE